MDKRRILVFPCGSEIGLEIHRSLKHSAHFDLVGASSLDDHGRFVYDDYVDGIPFIDDPAAIPTLREIVASRKIAAIYPAMDKVLWKLKVSEGDLGCRVIASSPETTAICLSKTRTYAHLQSRIKVPRVYAGIEAVTEYPVFAKPDVGYGTRGTFKADHAEELRAFLKIHSATPYILTEYLPGPEYTVDCFTDRHGDLRFVGPRGRERVSNGISVHTSREQDDADIFKTMARTLNQAISFRGAWFFQVKRDTAGELTLLEIASRLAGSSALHRALGVNFALLSLYDAFDLDVDIVLNDFDVELDRALNSRYKTNLSYSRVFMDFDDTLIVNGKVNPEAAVFLLQCRNEGKQIILISKHLGDLAAELARLRITELFDQVLHLKPDDEKSRYLPDSDAIFIDDSFSERKKVAQSRRIPVFDVHMLEALMRY